MTLFAAGGFNSVSLADIAREVGITQAGILHHFPTKAALLIAVLQQREEENLASQARRRAAGESPLAAYVGTLGENDLHPELVQLFVILSAESTATDHPGYEWFRRRHDKALASVSGWMREVVDETRLPQGLDVEMLARWLLAISHGLGAQWVLEPSAFDRAGAVGQFLHLITPYLRDSAAAASRTPNDGDRS